MNLNHEETYERLRQHIAPLGRAIVAYSGGVDSTLALKAALDALGAENVLGVTASSAAVPEKELEGARRTAADMGVQHRVVRTDELNQPGYTRNGHDRCFHCKTELYGTLEQIRIRENYSVILNGTNKDDSADYRPGLQAATDYHVRAPLAETGLGKAEIRELSRFLELSVWNKPASPCLSSRIPYFQEVNALKLSQIEDAEIFLHKRLTGNFRVRHHGEIARIEMNAEDFIRLTDKKIREEIELEFRRLGFRYAVLDLREFKSGNLNHALKEMAAESILS